MTGSTVSVERTSSPSVTPGGYPGVSSALRRFAWFVLGYNVLVVLWGSVVRATGSGGGCGAHWPLCNGAVVPQLAQFHTLVEFTHRMMSGAALILIALLLVWVWRSTGKGYLARWASVAAMVLVLNEAVLGALLVLLRLVEHNDSAARGVYLSFHFANTLLLLGSLTLAAEFLSRPRLRASTHLRHGALALPALGILATLVVGVSGSLAALGDTLFPTTSLAGAFQQDFSGKASLLLRLRWMHPASAAVAAVFVLWLVVLSLRGSAASASPRARSLAIAVLCALAVQLALGIADVLLLAPTWIQILHLFGADVFWILLLLLATAVCLQPPSSASARTGGLEPK